MDNDDCMVDIARFFMEFTVDESCGKCTPCRIGNKRILEMLERIIAGMGEPRDLRYLKLICETVRDTSLCGLGQSAPNPVLSTMKYFANEYEAHVKEKICPAHVCKGLAQYIILDSCIGCGKCKRNCPVSCITGEIKEKHVIDHDACIKCGACEAACPVHAIEKR